MNESKMDDLNVISQERLTSPEQLKAELPLEGEALKTVIEGRTTIRNILDRRDPRLFVVVGPCSIHDVDGALDYARQLKELAREVEDTLYVVMRVYFEKPRTTVGWKGYINDPQMDDSFNVQEGLRRGRKLLLELSELGLATATEALDPVMPQYLQDIISWSAIGARTTESQTHREMASGLSSAVGFKNGTDGSLEVAINALQSVSTPHRFLGITHQGEVSLIHTGGNRFAHIVLRGGGGNTNYDSQSVRECEERLKQVGIFPNIMLDCSHANSSKDFRNQPNVRGDGATQIVAGNQSIIGFMVESNIHEGNQSIPNDLAELKYGVSVTDSCVGMDTTREMLLGIRDTISDVLRNRVKADEEVAQSA